MILVPIGRDDSEIRRHAWISYAILAVNIALFIAMNIGARGDTARLQAKFEAAVEYLLEHPYLQVPAGLQKFIPPPLIPRLETARTLSPAPDGAKVAMQQEHLERLTSDLQKAVDDSPRMKYAYVPARPSLRTLVTSMFVHADFFHLIGNLLFFFVTAPFIEDVFGRPLFGLLYFTGGFIATWTHVWQHPGSEVPLVGASGAIAAVMGAYLIRFYRSKLEFFFVPFLWKPTLTFRFFLPAFVVLPLWFVSQVYLATTETELSSVAFWAHVGGFSYGLVFAGILLWLDVEARWINPVIENQISWTQREELVRAAEAKARGDLQVARQELTPLLSAEPDNVDARRTAFEVGIASGDWKYAEQHGIRLIDLYSRMGEHRLAEELFEQLPRPARENLSAAFFLRAAAYLDRRNEREWALGMYRDAAAKEPQSEVGFRARIAAAKLLRQAGNFAEARRELTAARAHPACNAEWRDTIDGHLANLR